jgi:hypothetical protein
MERFRLKQYVFFFLNLERLPKTNGIVHSEGWERRVTEARSNSVPVVKPTTEIDASE